MQGEEPLMDSGSTKSVNPAGPTIIEKFSKAYAWVILPSLAIMLLGAYWLASSQKIWEFVGEHYSQTYYAAKVITTVACFIYGVVILVLNRTALSSPEEWLTYIGWAFVTLFAMYVLSFSLEALALSEYSWWQMPLKELIFTGLSAGNNLLFLGAAFKLLDRPPFPRWSFYAQAGAWVVVNLLHSRQLFCYRFPGVLASTFCIGWLGYALYVNIYRPSSARRTPTSLSNSLRRDMARVVLISAIAYFVCEIGFAANPLIARYSWQKPFASLATIENSIKSRLIKDAMKQQAATLTTSPSPYLPQQTPKVDPQALEAAKLKLLDASVFTALFALKFIIFIAVFLLILDTIIILSAHSASTIFKPIIEANREFLTNSGITRSIVDAVGASLVELYIKIPGNQSKEFIKFHWPSDDGRELGRKVSENEIPDFVLDAFRTAEEQRLPNRNQERFKLTDYFPLAGSARLPSKIAEPLIFHGAVIGCLTATGEDERSFSRTAVQKIRDLTKFVTLDVQSFRESASLEQLGYRFSRILIGPESIKNFKSPVEAVADCLQDVLLPLATGLWVDIGLQNMVCNSYAGEAQYCQQLRDQMEGQGEPLETMEVIEMPLGVKRESKDEEIRIGRLALLVPKERDPQGSPILGRNEIYRRTVVTRTVTALIGITQEYLNHVLQRFGIGLNQAEMVETEEWFEIVKNTAEAAGLEWVIVDIQQGERVFSSTSMIRIAEDLKAVTDSREGAEQPYTLSPPLENADHFVCYRRSASVIYFGIRSTSYGKQLAMPLLKSFLDRFVDSANSSLVRIQAALVTVQHLKSEAEYAKKEVHFALEHSRVDIRVAEMTHQITNTARNFTEPVRVLRNALAVGRLRCDSERLTKMIECLPAVADQLFFWTSSFTNLSKLKDTRPCNLLQAASRSELLYEMFLHQHGVALKIDIDPAFQVDMPPDVVTLAIANLVDNSKNVIQPGGVITVTAQDAGDQIRCLVTDNGPGIPAHIQPDIFSPGVTTKTNGGGWGLFLTHQSLEVYKGSIELVRSVPDETTFAISLPKYKRQESEKEIG
jgi:signal transduction histidine kinase